MGAKSQMETPMMKQYLALKREHPDCVLFFRMGDFYEMFLEDAELAADVLDITLTSRSKGDDKVPMAGVPFHAAEGYLMKLVKAGYKVAIGEQVSDPKQPGLVKREVVRIVTPGTALEGETLYEHGANYVVALRKGKGGWGLAMAELSTGRFETGEIRTDEEAREVVNEITKLSPREVILCTEDYDNSNLLGKLRLLSGVQVAAFSRWEEVVKKAGEQLVDEERVPSLEALGLKNKPLAVECAMALKRYLEYTQQGNVPHLKKLSLYQSGGRMRLDRSTILNLELFSTLRSGERKGSLFDLLNRTLTGMGARMLRDWMVAPLIEKEGIERRLDGVEWLVGRRIQNSVGRSQESVEQQRSRQETRFRKQESTEQQGSQLTGVRKTQDVTNTKPPFVPPWQGGDNSARSLYVRERVRELLKEISDVERLVARLATGLGNARDVVSLRESIRRSLEARLLLVEAGSKELGVGENDSIQNLVSALAFREDQIQHTLSPSLEGENTLPKILAGVMEGIDPALYKLVEYLDEMVVDEPPADVRSGKMIRDGVSEELDELRSISGGGKDWLKKKELAERERTGIGNLKIKFNKVFGYYIEVSKSQTDLVPDEYERKQTLVNAERYITPELKVYEERVLTAEERIGDLEYELLITVVERLLQDTGKIQRLGEAIGVIDCLACLADLAVRQGYVRPVMLSVDSTQNSEVSINTGSQKSGVRSQKIQDINNNFQGIAELEEKRIKEGQVVDSVSGDSFKGIPGRAGEVKRGIDKDRGNYVINGGRHPVVEVIQGRDNFIPNNLFMGDGTGNLWLVTGPNMAGKSVFMRQVALISLMAQMGGFVSAEKALLPVVDGIFVRSGANDALAEGLSTFMVEMMETAYILRNVTSRSLVVMDEIGRGTSTFDGISLAWAIAEWFVRDHKVVSRNTEIQSKQETGNRKNTELENTQNLSDTGKSGIEFGLQGSNQNPQILNQVQNDKLQALSLPPCDTKIGGPWVLFATHYHELQELADEHEGIRNVQVAVEEDKDRLIFLHKVIPGGASHSHGVRVARLAGVPDEVVSRATEMLRKLEAGDKNQELRERIQNSEVRIQEEAARGSKQEKVGRGMERFATSSASQNSRNDVARQGPVQLGFGVEVEVHEVVKKLKELQVEELTPLEALNLLAEWKKEI